MTGSRVERNRKKRRLTLLIASLILVSVTTAGAIATAGGSRIPSGTTVLDLEVGGLTPEEAEQKLASWLKWDLRTVTVRVAEKKYNLKLSALGVEPMIPETIAQAPAVVWWKLAKSPRRLPLYVTIKEDVFASAVAGIGHDVQIEPVPARLEIDNNDRVLIKKETPGQRVDQNGLRELLLNKGVWTEIPSEITVPLRSVAPLVTEKSISMLGIKKLIGSYSTRYVEDGKRSGNIKLACSKIDGLLLSPGETFSFNEVVGPRDETGGYQEANVFINGKIVPGIGGGVCQVSSTLYNAALLANLKVVQRYNHYFAVDYVPLSRDATVAWNGPDLVLKNSLSHHVMFKASASNGVITVKVFGDAPQGQTVKIVSEILERKDFPVKTVVDPSKPQGYSSVDKGIPGYKSRAYRIVLIDGQEVSRELLSVDVYQPKPQIVTVAGQS
ncbi:MAG TPA: hypothetical protein GXX40_02860 [Firmicutes bacterium]|nr:hypothetical protein [Bacillota bacterium]